MSLEADLPSAKIEFKSKIKVRYYETDQMGVVHHSNYLRWMELARVEALDKLGLPYRELEREDIFLPVISCAIDYLKPCRFDDMVDICVSIEKPVGSRLNIHYTLFVGEQKVSIGNVTLAFTNRSGKPCRPSQKFRNLFNQTI